MVSLSQIRRSNSLISSTSPPLVALFVGATSGIGEASLKEFAKHAKQPRAYFVGRSQIAADRIASECQVLNPDGEYIFIKADVSLIQVVDHVCSEITRKETTLNILFLSPMVRSFDRSKTSENLHVLAALGYYARARFMTNLLPLLQQAPSLRRIVTVAGGTTEGHLDTTDFPALHVPLNELRGHLASLITLGLEALGAMAPDVSFVHDYPGTVMTGLYRDGVYPPAEAIDKLVPIEESGERHLFLATSAMFAPLQDPRSEAEGIDFAVGTTGKIGSGVYSVGWDCESASTDVMKTLASLRDKGIVEDVWRHTEAEFQRIEKSTELD